MKYMFLIPSVIGCFMVSGATLALAAKADNTGLQVKIFTPNGKSAIIENATSTIKYSISGLQNGAEDQYKVALDVVSLDGKGRQRIKSNTNLITSTSVLWNPMFGFVESFERRRVEDASDYTVPSRVVLVMNISQNKPMYDVLNAEERARLMKMGYTEKTLKLQLIPAIVASATSSPFLIYPTQESFYARVDQELGGYRDEFNIATKETFFPYGPGYGLRLDSVNAKKAVLSAYFLGKKTGQKLTLPVGKKMPFLVQGLYADPIAKTGELYREGTMTFLKDITIGGKFEMHLSTRRSRPGTQTPTTDYTDPKVTTERASIEVKYVSPFKVRILGTYNDIKSCDKNVKYNLVDGITQDILAAFVSNTCEKRNFDLTKFYKPGTQAVEIEMHAVRGRDWTHFIQDAILIRVAEDGTMEITPNPPSSWKKG